MNNMKPRPQSQMRRKTFRKHRPDNRRSNMNGSANNGNGNTADFENGSDIRTVKRAQTNREKYLNMARDALADGDRVQAENYFQHADHYLRIINAAEPVRPAYQPRPHSDRNEPSADGENQAMNGNNVPEENQGNTGNMVENNDSMETQALPAFIRNRETRQETAAKPDSNGSEENFNS